MRARSICILATLGLLGLVLAAHTSHAQGMAPGAAAPPLATLDLTKPGSPRPSAITQQAAPPTAAAAPATAAPKPTSPKAPPTTAKATPAKAKPGTVATTAAPTKKTTTKASPKAVKGKPAKPTTQTATASDR
jgi:hypothetical protein